MDYEQVFFVFGAKTVKWECEREGEKERRRGGGKEKEKERVGK